MKRKFSSAIFLFIIGIIIALTVSTIAIKEAYRGRKIEKEISDLKQQAERIQNDNRTFQNQIDYYNTPEFIEKVSKDKINLQKTDEQVVIINQNKAETIQAENQQNQETEESNNESNYKKWWYFFFKYNK